jgi:hypothetical protein
VQRQCAIIRSTRLDFPAPGRAGDADDGGATGAREARAQHLARLGAILLGEADGAGHRPHVARQEPGHELHARLAALAAARGRSRSRWISLVPSPIVQSFTSR